MASPDSEECYTAPGLNSENHIDLRRESWFRSSDDDTKTIFKNDSPERWKRLSTEMGLSRMSPELRRGGGDAKVHILTQTHDRELRPNSKLLAYAGIIITYTYDK